MPSSTARRRRSTFVGAGRPTSTYFARMRSRYSRAVECAMPSCIADELQRQARRVEVQHVALAPSELRLREVAVGLDRARPLDVVEHLALRDGGDGADHGRHRRRLGDDARRPGGERLAHGGDAVGDAVHEHGAARVEHGPHVLGHARPVAERQVEHHHVARRAAERIEELGHVRGLGDHLVPGITTRGTQAEPHRLVVVHDRDGRRSCCCCIRHGRPPSSHTIAVSLATAST